MLAPARRAARASAELVADLLERLDRLLLHRRADLVLRELGAHEERRQPLDGARFRPRARAGCVRRTPAGASAGRRGRPCAASVRSSRAYAAITARAGPSPTEGRRASRRARRARTTASPPSSPRWRRRRAIRHVPADARPRRSGRRRSASAPVANWARTRSSAAAFSPPIAPSSADRRQASEVAGRDRGGWPDQTTPRKEHEEDDRDEQARAAAPRATPAGDLRCEVPAEDEECDHRHRADDDRDEDEAGDHVQQPDPPGAAPRRSRAACRRWRRLPRRRAGRSGPPSASAARFPRLPPELTSIVDETSAARRTFAPSGGDGDRQRHAGQFLRRRRAPRTRTPRSRRRGRCSPDGAAIVDVGGESTRPGAEPVDANEELRRVVPVLEGLAGLPVSIDTAKAEVARRALELGAELVNDVTALRGDPELAGVVADAGAYVCLMHMQGEPRTMQAAPRYDDVVVRGDGVPRGAARLRGRGGHPRGAHLPRPRDRLRQDARPEPRARPRGSTRSSALGRPVLVGLSRKSTIGKALGDPEATVGSVDGSVGAAVAAFDRGASIFRVHDVRPARGGARSGRRRRSSACSGFAIDASRDRAAPAIELLDRVARLPRRPRRGAARGPALPGRRLARAGRRRAAASDRIEDAVDYRDVVAVVREVSERRAYRLLEALAAAIADALLERLPVARVRVRVRKPDVVLELPVEHAAVRSSGGRLLVDTVSAVRGFRRRAARARLRGRPSAHAERSSRRLARRPCRCSRRPRGAPRPTPWSTLIVDGPQTERSTSALSARGDDELATGRQKTRYTSRGSSIASRRAARSRAALVCVVSGRTPRLVVAARLDDVDVVVRLERVARRARAWRARRQRSASRSRSAGHGRAVPTSRGRAAHHLEQLACRARARTVQTQAAAPETSGAAKLVPVLALPAAARVAGDGMPAPGCREVDVARAAGERRRPVRRGSSRRP